MNYKTLFMATILSMGFVRAWHSALPAFSLEKRDTVVLVTVNTGKKVTADDIAITHKNNQVMVDVKGLDHTLTLKLESSKHALQISLCSQTHQEDKNEHEFRSYQGSSCMQQLMSFAVDLSEITAEYSGTNLILSMPLIKETQGKKIPVVMKNEQVQEEKQKTSERRIDEK